MGGVVAGKMSASSSPSLGGHWDTPRGTLGHVSEAVSQYGLAKLTVAKRILAQLPYVQT